MFSKTSFKNEKEAIVAKFSLLVHGEYMEVRHVQIVVQLVQPLPHTRGLRLQNDSTLNINILDLKGLCHQFGIA
jgi:hypothetical protein